MTVTAEVNVYGLREALKELGRLGPEARFKAVAEIKAAAGPLVAIGRENYPTFVPLSGWSESGRLGFKPGAVAKGVQVQVGGRQPKGADAFNVVTLVQKNAGGALYDLAGLRGGTVPGRNGPNPSFVAALDAEFGKAQRGLWRSVKRVRDFTYAEIRQAVEKVAADANRRLV